MKDSLQQLLQITLRELKLKANQNIVDYLKARGIKKASADLWRIGYLSDQQLLLEIENLDSLRSIGVVTRGDFSPLHQYVTFPLYNQYGELIGISGRTLQTGKVKRKYWHSILNKRRFLFGLDKAISSIRTSNAAIVTEGQFDVITAHQSGITNVVGTMGTALTPDHITLLARYTDRIYVVFDGDSAGRKASESQVMRNRREDIELIPILLPSGEDLDSFIRKNNAQAFLDILTQDSLSSDIDL